ncbi:hypothetical protein O6H91_14G067200 [Diphasiastrum complanatum]|uniref:Uncharacterized protein n=1 Tax=Diphasiastrum complanatum TaxID=34168 RepID=A0ACC2BQB0_DIPCM|nr:hypothetical protein O6H91_14G067200 [Diphasiastrum complanatum]
MLVANVENVGMACAQTIFTQELAEEIALVDVEEKKLKGEMLDLQHAGAFVPRVNITVDIDYAISAARIYVLSQQEQGKGRGNPGSICLNVMFRFPNPSSPDWLSTILTQFC